MPGSALLNVMVPESDALFCLIYVALDHICGPLGVFPVFLPPTATGHTCVSLPGHGCIFQLPPSTAYAKGHSAFPKHQVDLLDLIC